MVGHLVWGASDARGREHRQETENGKPFDHRITPEMPSHTNAGVSPSHTAETTFTLIGRRIGRIEKIVTCVSFSRDHLKPAGFLGSLGRWLDAVGCVFRIARNGGMSFGIYETVHRVPLFHGISYTSRHQPAGRKPGEDGGRGCRARMAGETWSSPRWARPSRFGDWDRVDLRVCVGGVGVPDFGRNTLLVIVLVHAHAAVAGGIACEGSVLAAGDRTSTPCRCPGPSRHAPYPTSSRRRAAIPYRPVPRKPNGRPSGCGPLRPRVPPPFVRVRRPRQAEVAWRLRWPRVGQS